MTIATETATTAKPTAPAASAASLALRALRTAAAHVEWTLARALEPFGLTVAQFSALQILHEAEDTALDCSAIRARLAGPAPDVTRLLDRLESASLVARERDTTDRRLVHTRLTSAGRELLASAAPAVHDAEEQALSGLDAAERAQLGGLLAGVRRNCPGS